MHALDDLGDSRTKILEILRRGRCSIDEFHARLDISPTAIRQHLAILEKDSLVAKIPLRTGTGRPRYVYSLTEKAESYFPKAYEMLASDLITEIYEHWGRKALLDVLENIARSRGKELLSMVKGRTEEERLVSAVKLMNELGYYIDWEREKEGYSIRVHNCVFSNLVKKHENLLCTHDHTFFQTILHSKIKKDRSRTQGAEYCSFYLVKD
jgi:predicted ArsR family transcriptional regulator